MRTRHTRRTDESLNGPSVQKSLRLPQALVGLTDRAIERGIPEIHTLTDAVTDALWLWLYEQRRAQPGLLAVVTADPVVTSASTFTGTFSQRPTFADVDLDGLDEPEAEWDGV